MGQIRWRVAGSGFEVRHERDGDSAVDLLRKVETLMELEEVVRRDGDGKYRPLRGEMNLAQGWFYWAKSSEELREVLEVIYPGLWGNAEAWADGRLKFQTWDEALAKQTERVRNKAANIGDLPQKVIEENCKRRCSKTVLWAGERPMDGVKSVPMLCTGPCGMFWSCVES